MSRSLAAINRLRRVAAVVAEHGGDDAEWFAACLADYEAGAAEGMEFGEAFGLMPARGCQGWWTIEARERRDAIVGLMADEFLPGRSEREQAVEIAKRLTRYETSAWRQDRPFRSAPAKYRGLIEEHLFDVLKRGEAPSTRTIQRILAARRGENLCQMIPPFDGTPITARCDHDDEISQADADPGPCGIQDSDAE